MLGLFLTLERVFNVSILTLNTRPNVRASNDRASNDRTANDRTANDRNPNVRSMGKRKAPAKWPGLFR